MLTHVLDKGKKILVTSESQVELTENLSAEYVVVAYSADSPGNKYALSRVGDHIWSIHLISSQPAATKSNAPLMALMTSWNLIPEFILHLPTGEKHKITHNPDSDKYVLVSEIGCRDLILAHRLTDYSIYPVIYSYLHKTWISPVSPKHYSDLADLIAANSQDTDFYLIPIKEELVNKKFKIEKISKD